MKLETIATVTMAQHWLPAIVNGDYSGLSDEEEAQLVNWLGRNPAEIYSTESDVDAEFARDDVSGLMASCYTVTLVGRESHSALSDQSVGRLTARND